MDFNIHKIKHKTLIKMQNSNSIVAMKKIMRYNFFTHQMNKIIRKLVESYFTEVMK